MESGCRILCCSVLGGSLGEHDAPSPHLSEPQSPALLPLAGLFPPPLFLLACGLAPIKQARLDSKANLLRAMQINPPRKTKGPSVSCFQRKTKESECVQHLEPGVGSRLCKPRESAHQTQTGGHRGLRPCVEAKLKIGFQC